MRSRWQFSLAQLFVWVALVAACFSLGRFFRSAGTGVMAVGLGVFTYLALRRALRRASATPAGTADPAGREGGRPRASWWWRLTLVLAALAGLWVLGVDVSARMDLFGWFGLSGLGPPGLSPHSPFCLLLWWSGSMAVGVTTVGLVRLWMGGSLGRWHSAVFALALGWLIVFGRLALHPERTDWILFWFVVMVAQQGVVGLLAVVLLPRYGARAARASAVGAAATLGIILLGLLVSTGSTLAQEGYIHLRHLILGMAGAWLAGIGAGTVGGLVGAIGDRRDIARPQAGATEAQPSSVPAVAAWRRCAWLAGKGGRIVLAATVSLLVVALCLAIVDLRSENSVVASFRHSVALTLDGIQDVAEHFYSRYADRLTEEAQRRQTIELPPVDKVEVFLLDTGIRAHQGLPTWLFPSCRPGDRDCYAPILRQATVTGPEAEALARLWRMCRTSERDPDQFSVAFESPYALRFYAGRCLILEVGGDYLTDGGLAYGWNVIQGAKEPLALRLQELAPFPEHDRALLAIALGRAYLAKKLPDKAEAQFRRALQLDENAAGAHDGLGQLLEARGDSKGALAAYDKALAAHEEAQKASTAINAAPENGLGTRFGSLVSSIDGWSVPFEEHEGFYHRARLHYAMRNYDLAMADVNRAIEHERLGLPETPNYHAVRAAIHLEMGAPHAALADLEIAARRSSPKPELLRLRAKAYHALGRPEDAEKALQEARDLERVTPRPEN